MASSPSKSLLFSRIGFTYSFMNSTTWPGALPINFFGSMILSISSLVKLISSFIRPIIGELLLKLWQSDPIVVSNPFSLANLAVCSSLTG